MIFSKCVINRKFEPIAFITLEGEYWDYAFLCRSHVADEEGRFEFRKTGVVERKEHALRGLELRFATEEGDPGQIVNSKIEAASRIIKDGKTVGYVLRDPATGATVRKNLANIEAMSRFLTPVNFSVARRNGGIHLSGLSGASMDDLPILDLSPPADDSKTEQKRTSGISIMPQSAPPKPTSASLITFVDRVRECGGQLLWITGDKYERVSDPMSDLPEGFIPNTHVCEIAEPYLNPGSTNLSGNVAFRRHGIYRANGTPIMTYVYRTKSVAFNGELHSDRIGAVLPSGYMGNFAREFGTALSPKVEAPANSQLLKSAADLSGIKTPGVCAFRPETVLADKPDKYILPYYKLCSNVGLAYKYTLLSKALKEILSDLKAQGIGTASDVAPNLRNLSADFLPKLSGLIDLSTGACIAKVDRESNPNAQQPVEIGYQLANFPRVQSCTAVELVAGACKDIPESVKDKIAEYANCGSSLQERAELCATALKKARQSLSEIQFELWQHKIAMFTGDGIHKHDAGEWIADSSARRKVTAAYSRDKLVMVLKGAVLGGKLYA